MGFENGKLLRVALKAQHVSGRTNVNTYHYDLDDGLVPAEANDPQLLADAFRDDVVPLYKTLFDPGWSIGPVEVQMERDPLNPFAPRQAWTSGGPVVGTRTTPGESLPGACTSVTTLLTEHIGRRFRGRHFLSGTTLELDQNAGTWQSGIIALWQAYLDVIPREPDIAPPLSTATAKWCVYSRTQRAANLDPYASAITGTNLRAQVHWLRSRER